MIEGGGGVVVDALDVLKKVLVIDKRLKAAGAAARTRSRISERERERRDERKERKQGDGGRQEGEG